MVTIHKSQIIKRLLLKQTMLVLLAALMVISFSSTAALSVVLGGMLQIIPNGYFALNAYRYRGAKQARFVVGKIYQGEMGKFVLTMVGFAVIYMSAWPVNNTILLTTYIVLILTQAVQISRLSQLNDY